MANRPKAQKDGRDSRGWWTETEKVVQRYTKHTKQNVVCICACMVKLGDMPYPTYPIPIQTQTYAHPSISSIHPINPSYRSLLTAPSILSQSIDHLCNFTTESYLINNHLPMLSIFISIPYPGLKHPQLFRNVFHQPSVEASLSMFANPRKNHLFSVKMMRIDTVAGLLTTALSRTYPPLIPVHIQEMFQNPNGKNKIGSMLFFQGRKGEHLTCTVMHPQRKRKMRGRPLNSNLDRAFVCATPPLMYFTDSVSVPYDICACQQVDSSSSCWECCLSSTGTCL